MAPRHSELSMQLVARHHQESVRLPSLTCAPVDITLCIAIFFCHKLKGEQAHKIAHDPQKQLIKHGKNAVRCTIALAFVFAVALASVDRLVQEITNLFFALRHLWWCGIAGITLFPPICFLSSSLFRHGRQQ